MKTNLKNSLFLGMAALGFVAAASSIDANAASTVKVTSNVHLSKNVNVNTTGKNGIYTKAGTLKGARVLADTSEAKRINKSDSGQDNVLAYRMATTNRGSVYYKVVTFDKSYRGWIYGGKTKNSFGGGLTKYTTFKTGSVSSDDSNKKFYIKTPGTANDNQSTTYTAPAWTEMGKGRTVTDSSKYANDELTITKLGTRTREGDTWVYVTDSENPSFNGWILRSGLTTTNSGSSVDATDGITIKYVDASGNDISSKVVSFAPSTTDSTTMDMTSAINDNMPAGYSKSTQTATTAKKGDTITVTVTQNKKTTSLNINMKEKSGESKLANNDIWNYLSDEQQEAVRTQINSADNQVVTGTTWTSDKIQAVIEKALGTSFKISVDTTTKQRANDSSDAKNVKEYTVKFSSADDVKVAKDATVADATAYFTVGSGTSLGDIFGDDSSLSDILNGLGLDSDSDLSDILDQIGLGSLSDILGGLGLGSDSGLSDILNGLGLSNN
ncbi:hypothetical protein [Lentilactobacillus laojiaonis]|uniref:hypothetical protein n=1 Tax=Lentilactobacillus laojiaonis TaxID=2883998 RepID=UPI001D0B167F|nr:hypothetical protein [Lentilactobacillus laojiaonis]UDM31987.1 hypothetical protein LHL71_05530 [Lentilactobacillus laojiaonis]